MADLYADWPAMAAAAKEAQAQMTTVEDKCLEILKLKSDAPATALLNELLSQAIKFQAGSIANLYGAAQEAVSFQVSPVK